MPFKPWVQTITRRYEELPQGIPFVGGGLFRSVWFTYVHLIQFEGNKTCPSCGDYPENVIWDGVSISFGRKHINNELRPPTLVQDKAPERQSRPCPRLEWLWDSNMQKKLRDWLFQGGLGISKEDKDDYQLQLEGCVQHAKSLQLELYLWLHSHSPHLKELFNCRLGYGAVQPNSKKWTPRREYLVLFQIIAADEITMQAVTRRTLQNLHSFVALPTTDNLQAFRAKEVIDTLLTLNYAPLELVKIPTELQMGYTGEFREWEKGRWGVVMVCLRFATVLDIQNYHTTTNWTLVKKELAVVESTMRRIPRSI
ncbi:hypothetical protein GYMLUDRAFT_248796 [Collybiopsis luxurians FD-317 M1]|uniref:Uncharacterized protein n=1 Tax=Collybiopsis luxurians FD-317 M1 TaxID=944289 RepID=A0A0D0BKD9_9AGAR|nr:hypothetical protein GYMLUDRAFT_248796 [Collybiopsis luxurians FD-317 M1]